MEPVGEPGFGGRIERLVDDSEAWWPDPPRPPAYPVGTRAPNSSSQSMLIHGAMRTNPSTEAAALFEHADPVSGLRQRPGACDARQAGADDCDV